MHLISRSLRGERKIVCRPCARVCVCVPSRRRSHSCSWPRPLRPALPVSPFPALCGVGPLLPTVLCVWSCVGVVLCVGGAGAACLSACGASLSTLEAHRAQHC